MRRFHRNGLVWPQPAISWSALPAPTPERLSFLLKPEETALVQPGQSIKKGQALTQGPVTQYAPVSGTVTSVDQDLLTVQNDFLDLRIPVAPNPTLDDLTPKQVLDAIAHCGSADPTGRSTSEKITQLRQSPRQILLSCVDCASSGLHQAATFYHRAEQILGGLRILLRMLGVSHSVLMLPAQYKTLLEKADRLIPVDGAVSLHPVRPRYPAYSEEELLHMAKLEPETTLVLWGREAAAIYDSVYCGTPVLTQMITLTTPHQAQCMQVLLGTPVSLALSAANLLSEDTTVLLGDGLTGRKLENLEIPIDRTCLQLTLLPERPAISTGPCIHCGRCSAVCPLHLRPDRIYARQESKTAGAYLIRGAHACLLCGLCQYACPAGLPLLSAMEQLAKEPYPQEVMSHG